MAERWASTLGLTSSETDTLRRAPLLQGLSDDALARLLDGALVHSPASGTTLFVQDEPAERIYLVLDGWVKLYRLAMDGNEAIVSVVAPGETFAEAASFANALYPVCADAVVASRVLALAIPAFERAIAADGTIALRMLASLSRRLRTLVGQIEHLQVMSAPQRLAAFLGGLCPTQTGAAVLALPLPKALIAQRLGMRPETLSRALQVLRSIGVTRQGEAIAIADVAALLRYAGTDRAYGCD